MKGEPGRPLLCAKGLTAGYGVRTALREIELRAEAGDLLAIIGPNGAGKSTLLKVLGGLLQPWRGEVEIDGRPLDGFDRRSLARAVASVAQENPIAFQFSVLEVVLMGRAPHLGAFHLETPRDVEVARAALETFGLEAIAARPIQELSGGERKRVFLARAMAQETPIVLLDEPTAFLDLRHVAEIFTLFRRLCAERGTAVIATLHDLNVAALYADHVLLLKDGACVAYGSPAEVLTATNLSVVYETGVYVGRHPVSGAIMIWPVPSEVVEGQREAR
ncbi:MAG TPA: ABC transporter ATP-binding protein [Candidatus Binataceae bacterium]|nr:ABC transporter ATP-binding protein [Candidatus Binataceae bacterium]